MQKKELKTLYKILFVMLFLWISLQGIPQDYLERFKKNPSDYKYIINEFYEKGMYDELYNFLIEVSTITNFYELDLEIVKVGGSIYKNVSENLKRVLASSDVHNFGYLEVFRDTRVINDFSKYIVEKKITNRVILSRFSYLCLYNDKLEEIIYILSNGFNLESELIANLAQKFYNYREYEIVTNIYEYIKDGYLDSADTTIFADSFLHTGQPEKALELLNNNLSQKSLLIRTKALLYLGDIESAYNEAKQIMYTQEGLRLYFGILINRKSPEKEILDALRRIEKDYLKSYFHSIYTILYKHDFISASEEMKKLLELAFDDDIVRNQVATILYVVKTGSSKEEILQKVLSIFNEYEGITTKF